MSEKQHWVIKQARERLASENSLANTTAYNTTNPFFIGTSDIPVENFTLPLDHFGNNSGKLKIGLHLQSPLSVDSLRTLPRY